MFRHKVTGPIIAFDADNTILRQERAIAMALEQLAGASPDGLPTADLMADTGAPMDARLRRYLPEDEAKELTQKFNQLMDQHAPKMAEALPGAYKAFETIRTLGGLVIVISAKRQALLERTLTTLRLKADTVVGDCYDLGGLAKADAILKYNATMYIGDDELDMQAVRSANNRKTHDGLIRAIGVTTGRHDEAALYEAGAHEVLASLEELPSLVHELYSD